ncbi:DUF5050 domain-containing protein [Clostridium sp. BJN0001]|uniref:DUF5050 domain-containing protein n=1 Tax=Clostridium sp. BJN0001 TaxID=2930219 RepID=UPI001FD48BCF|nr:DUF5050 domain-containing protein [Clostridium sp. BJN0001]
MIKKSKMSIIILIAILMISIISIMFLSKKGSINKNVEEESSNIKKEEENSTDNKNDISKDKVDYIKYNKYYIDDDIKDYANPSNKELYKKIYDAVEKIEQDFDAQNYEISYEESEHLKNAILDRMAYEFFYLKNVQYDENSKKFKFYYWIDKNNIEKMKAEFNKKVDSLVYNIVESSNSDLEKELNLLLYLSENSKFEVPIDFMNSGVYGILINKKGVCKDYTATVKYIFDRVGIESHSVTIKNDNIFHAINEVKIDGEYYYLDASNSTSQSLDIFNFTEKELKEFYRVNDGEFYLGNFNYKKIKVFKSDNYRFSFLRRAVYPKFDNGYVYYCNFSDEGKIYKAELENGETAKALTQDSSIGMVMYKDYIYYINNSDSDHIYKIKKDGTGRESVDNTINATEIKIIDDKLYYTDGEKEISKNLSI